MDTTAEAILKALLAALTSAAPAGVTVARNVGVQQRIPAAGLAILRDGDPGEPEVTMSPLRWHWRHRAELELLVEGSEGGQREARFDALRRWVAGVVAADRTLGGSCDWIEADPPAVQEIAGENGTAPVKAGTLGIVLHFSTAGEMG